MNNRNTVLFETVLEGSPRDLIKASELRRKMLYALSYKNNAYDDAYEYYKYLCGFLIPTNVTKKSVLFVWNDKTSSCWQFEKIHILSILSHWAHERAAESDTREAKHWIKRCIEHARDSLFTLNSYTWIDSDNAMLPMLHHRYHLAKLFLYTSDYFFNMYTFKEHVVPIRKSFQMLELASRVWANLEYVELDHRRALTLRHIALELGDDKAGERVGLLQKACELYQGNEELMNDLRLYQQQNDHVYYQPVTCAETIPLLSLEDSFQSVSNILAQS